MWYLSPNHLKSVLADSGADVCIALLHLETPGIRPANHVLPSIAVHIVGRTHGFLDLVSGTGIYTPADESVPGALPRGELATRTVALGHIAASFALINR